MLGRLTTNPYLPLGIALVLALAGTALPAGSFLWELSSGFVAIGGIFLLGLVLGGHIARKRVSPP